MIFPVLPKRGIPPPRVEIVWRPVIHASRARAKIMSGQCRIVWDSPSQRRRRTKHVDPTARHIVSIISLSSKIQCGMRTVLVS